MKLKDLLKDIDFTSDKKIEEINKIEIEDICYDSKKAGENIMFTALLGETTDGHNYIKSAYEKGSRVFLISREVDLPVDAVKILVKNTRKVLSHISSNLYNHPSKELKIIGITGTKGKTTTSNYIRAIFEAAGYKTGIIGTNGVFYGDVQLETVNTTPESYEIQKILRAMIEEDVKFVVMEVSSGGLKMNRVDDIEIDLGLFTNISKDHIGPKEHPDFEDYMHSKAKLFKLAKHAIINIDDKHSAYMIDNATCGITTISSEVDSDFRAKDIELSGNIKTLGSSFTCVSEDGAIDYKISSPGMFSIYNALLSIAAARHFKIEHSTIKDVLKDVNVSGRVEILPLLDYASIVLDFAHNEVSLKNIVDTLNHYNPKRLICLIGSVGNRSILRRKELGDVAASECDVCILTSDNPDFEDPMKIINEMSESFSDSDCILIKEADRKQAIIRGINMLEEDDILLLSGKGHENYQIIEGEKVYFSDKETAEEAAKDLLNRKV